MVNNKKKFIYCKQFSDKSKLPSELSVDNEMINTNSQIFLDQLCDYFANIGATVLEPRKVERTYYNILQSPQIYGTNIFTYKVL